MISAPNPHSESIQARAALALRLGLGMVFIIGGIAKLEQLLNPAKAQGLVEQYLSPLGYINQTFLDWLFAGPLGAVLTPWSFLTALSTFELVAGVMLVVGLMVRPLALVWALLLWSFVVSLPVVTTPGVTPEATTYQSPAAFVQIRDIALSGFFFALYNLGSGTRSLDAGRFSRPPAFGRNWEPLGLLLRLSLGLVFLVGGFFAGYSRITTFGMPGALLAIIGLGLVAGVGLRIFATAAAAVLLWFIISKISDATAVIGFFNSVKREFALLAGAAVLSSMGGGRMFTLDKAWGALRGWWGVYFGGARHVASGGS